MEVLGFGLGVEQQQKAVVHHALPLGVGGHQFRAVEENADGFGGSVVPLLLGNFLAAGVVPADVVDAGTMDGSALEPVAAGEVGVLARSC